MYILYHMSWERKPSYSSLTFDGKFPSWEEALRCAFENILNGDVDPGEILPSDFESKKFSNSIPTSKEGIISIFPGICFSKYEENEFTEFWSENRCYHIKKLD